MIIRGFARWVTCLLGLAVAGLAALGLGAGDLHATDTPIYTLPFTNVTYSMICGFHCYYDPLYGWHEGVDYEVGQPGVGGEQIVAAADGIAKPCPEDFAAGYYVVIDHGGGNRTRYLHFNSQWLSGDQPVVRGQIIGFEGNNGYTVPPGLYHLHFETRVNAQGAATCGKDGTAVDPYAAGDYMWTTNPPAIAPCITPSIPYKDGLLVRQDGDTGVYVIYGQTKYFLSYDNFNEMGFDWGAIQCVTVGVLGSIASVPYDKTLIREFGDTGIYVVDCGARFLIPNPDVLNMMVGNGYANWPWYDIPPGDRDAQTDTVPREGCHLRVDGDTAQYITCRDPGRKWWLSPYDLTRFGLSDATLRVLWPAGPGYPNALDFLTTLGRESLRDCPDRDTDPWNAHWSDLSEQFMGTDPGTRCAADTIPNNEGPPDRWPPDFNDDRAVTLTEVLTLNLVFNSSAPGPPYNPRYDLNSDDEINLGDVLVLGSVFNKTCT